MTQKISFSKSRGLGLYLDVMKRHRGIAILYGVAMFIACPFIWFMDNLNRVNYDYSVTFYDNGLIGILLVGLGGAFVISTVILRFMHNKQAMDMYYSLPVKRETMLLSHALAGLTLVLAPVLVNFLLTMGIEVFFGRSSIPSSVWNVLLLFLVVITATYAIIVLVATVVGTSFDTVVFGAVFHFAIPIVVGLVSLTVSMNLYGFDYPEGLTRFILYSAPSLISVAYFSDWNVLLSAVIWLLASIGLFALSAVAFKRRKSEFAGRALENGFLHVIVKMIVSFAGGFLMMVIFTHSVRDDLGFALIGFAFGAAITFIFIHSILARGFKTLLKSWLQVAVLLVVSLVLVLISYTDPFGYETYIPDLSKVKAVSISEHVVIDERIINWEYTGSELTFEGKEEIEAVARFHEEALNLRDDHYGWSARIVYTLDSGRTISRYYNTFSEEARQELVASIDITKIIRAHPIFQAKKIDSLMIVDRFDNSEDVRLDATKQKKLIEALRNDILNKGDNGDAAYQCYLQVDNMYFRINSQYTNTLGLLESWGYEKYTQPDVSTILRACVYTLPKDIYEYDFNFQLWGLLDDKDITWELESAEDFYDLMESVDGIRWVTDLEEMRSLAQNIQIAYNTAGVVNENGAIPAGTQIVYFVKDFGEFYNYDYMYLSGYFVR